MKLFTFFLSGSSYRARIALNLKGIDYEPCFLVVAKGSEDLADPEYRKLNPQGVIPTLVDGDTVLNQSMAIIEYLEETRPDPPLLPADPAGRARVRAIAGTIACDTHPLITLRVIAYLDDILELPADDKRAWLQFWNARGLGAVETMLADGKGTGKYCHGDTPTMADALLIPQVSTAQRFGIDTTRFPEVTRVYEHCMAEDAFRKAAPENQPDAK